MWLHVVRFTVISEGLCALTSGHSHMRWLCSAAGWGSIMFQKFATCTCKGKQVMALWLIGITIFLNLKWNFSSKAKDHLNVCVCVSVCVCAHVWRTRTGIPITIAVDPQSCANLSSLCNTSSYSGCMHTILLNNNTSKTHLVMSRICRLCAVVL